MFKRTHSPYELVHFCWSLKNLLVLVYSKLRSKSCDYLYKYCEEYCKSLDAEEANLILTVVRVTANS